MPVDPVILSAKFRDPRRVKRRFVPQSDEVRRFRAMLRTHRGDGFERSPRVRDASSGPVTAALALPRASREQPSVNLRIDRLEIKMPVDPAVTAAHERALGEEAIKRAEDAEIDRTPGFKGLRLKTVRLLKRHTSKFCIGLLILVDRLNLGLNLNSFASTLLGAFRWLRP